MPASSMNRRDFARLFAAGGSAALLGHPALEGLARRTPSGPLARGSGAGQVVDWDEVRARFLMPPELSVMNAANLCPSPASTLQAVYDYTERMDREPVPSFRGEMARVKEPTRDRLAEFLGVTPEEILITRNTSEANNWVSTGLQLGLGDEVVIMRDNHPSNNLAWKAKGQRFGYTVREIEPASPHPGADYYVRAFREAITPNTRVISFTHLTNTAGDLFPARELCTLAREHGVFSVVDGAQSFGLFDIDLSEVQPDFYTGSAHKWPCGPKETGVLYVNARVHDRFWPTMYSAYTGSRGLARTHEGLGQRDEPAIRAFGAQIEFLQEITMAEVEARSRELATALVEELSALDGVHMWTSQEPSRRAAVVTFRPGELSPGDVVGALENDGIVAASRGGSDRTGVRLSPHFYNSHTDVERAVSAVRGYLRTGL
ncbi:MAG: aminotransferase class V-fold PLP-dependent enzyme [Gammaproteobacteria bacterium]|nr:aminotransferase class V-fold PLP-dependent enzyme [Gammaproteobacteria bacterium]